MEDQRKNRAAIFLIVYRLPYRDVYPFRHTHFFVGAFFVLIGERLSTRSCSVCPRRREIASGE